MAKGFSGWIKNCCDSHVHWLATGQFARRLALHQLRDPELDLPRLTFTAEQLDRPWLLGFGWDQNLFVDQKFPTHESLDLHLGHLDKPIYFVRVDGHAAWVNRRALELAGLWQKNPSPSPGGQINLKADGYPSGVVLDQAMHYFDKLLPMANEREVKADLLEGQRVFLSQGFTHIRDMSCDDLQWSTAQNLEKDQVLSLAVEQFFSADNPNTFDEQLRKALFFKSEGAARPTASLRVAGVKIYVDGALGSEGAWLSQPYLTAAKPKHCGLQLIDEPTIEDFIYKAWSIGMPIAVHVIGDEAVHCVVRVARKLRDNKNLNGTLHLEHVELVRPETVLLMKGLNLVCHMQPCHFLSDRAWLQAKLGPLAQHAFRWRALEAADVQLRLGSDSPIEPPSLQRNFDAVEAAAREGIWPPVRPLSHYHTRLDDTLGPDTSTKFENGVAKEVWIRGRQYPSV